MSEHTIKLTVTTPDGNTFEENVEKLSITTTDGEITILPHHIPLITTLATGEIRITKQSKETPLIVYGGFIEVRPDNEVIVLADGCERVEELELEQIKNAKEKAEEILKSKFNTADYEEAALNLERELKRLHIARKYKHGGARDRLAPTE